MNERIRPDHHRRLAVVYIRQSSPGQVSNHPESYRVQKGLAKRAAKLGWSEEKIRIIEGDQGCSASIAGNRDDFNSLLQLVQDKQVGIVFGLDVSRLARNNLDWSLLTHWCALHGALLGDQTQVFDPALPQDSLVLGIQGALAVHELHSIRRRLESALQEKASRGELHHGVPRGYVVVNRRHLRKHPDRRVQRAIERVFEEFKNCSSVSRLITYLWEENILLPRSLSGDGTQVDWTPARYQTLLDMLQNPKYAGTYIYPRFKKETAVAPDGKVKKIMRRIRPEEWEVVLENHHPAYIGIAEYEANQAKIAMNTQRFTPTAKGAPNKGSALLTGLIECRRCHHKMQVHYCHTGAVSYHCRYGRRQREGRTPGCFRFPAEELQRQLVEQIIYAVSPAGVVAAELAAARLAEERASQRKGLEDEMEHLRYEANLSRRRFDNVDPDNHLVFDTLAVELESALQTARQGEEVLQEFDRDQPVRPTPEERKTLQQMSQRLEDLWYHSQTDGRLKKQIVRLLIEHVMADVDEERDEVVLWIKWAGGHHTQLRVSRRRRRRPQIDLPSIIDTLRKIGDDDATSRALNRAGTLNENGTTWTKKRVAQFRRRHGIDAFDAQLKEQSGWLSQQQAATYLDISPMSLNRLIRGGIFSSEGFPGHPQVVDRTDLDSQQVITAVQQIKTHGNSPLPKNPNQLNLF